MFKTILKTLALSATTLTLLSACGASEALNAAIRNYEANQQAASKKSGSESSGFLSVGSDKEKGDSEDDGKYYPAVLAQESVERTVPNQPPEPEKQPIAEESRAIEEQPIAEESRPIESIEKQPIADNAEPAPYISTVVHPGTNTYIMDPPFEDDLLVIEPPLVKAARLAEEARIAEELRVAEEARLARLAEEKRIAEESSSIEEPTISYEEENRLAILAEKLRIQTELKADPSAFNTAATRVASIRIAGTHDDDGTFDNGDNTYDLTRSKTQDTFSISRDEGEDPGLIMTVNGVEHDIVPFIDGLGFSDGKVVVYYNEKTTGTYFAGNADIRKIIRGTHVTIQGGYIAYATDTTDYDASQSPFNVDYTKGFATVGIQTPAPVVATQTAVATYKGNGSLFSDSSSGGDIFWPSFWVSITMNVDFDANTITGTGSERHSQNKIIFNSAPIVGNGFDGTFTLNSSVRNYLNLNGNPTGQYGGNFFGANADDLAGVMSFQGTSRDLGVDIIGYGGFRADRQ